MAPALSPFVDFHNPPLELPTYTLFPVGSCFKSTAKALARPDMARALPRLGIPCNPLDPLPPSDAI